MAHSEFCTVIAVLKFLAAYGSIVIALALLIRWICLRKIRKNMMNLPIPELQDLAMGSNKTMPEWERKLAIKVMIWRNQNKRTG